MKKGFTLVEVLAVIVIVGLIFLIAFPTMLNSIKTSQNKIDSNTHDLIVNATKEYENDHLNELEDNYCIKISTLINEGYIDEDIITAKDSKLINQSIDYKDNKFEIIDKCK